MKTADLFSTCGINATKMESSRNELHLFNFITSLLVHISFSFPELLISSDWQLKWSEVCGSLSVSAARKAVRSGDGCGVRVPGCSLSCPWTELRSARVCCQTSTRWRHFSTILPAPDSCWIRLRGIQTSYDPGATLKGCKNIHCLQLSRPDIYCAENEKS